MVEVVRLPIPSALYERLKRRAEQSHRTIEAELLEVVITATTADELPQVLADWMMKYCGGQHVATSLLKQPHNWNHCISNTNVKV